MSGFVALDRALGGRHHDYCHNQKLYFDPYKGRWEPIEWDFGIWYMWEDQERQRARNSSYPDSHRVASLMWEFRAVSTIRINNGRPGLLATPLSIFLFVVPHLCGPHHRQTA